MIRPPWQREALRDRWDVMAALVVVCVVFVSVSAWLLPPPPAEPCRGLVMADCGQR